MKPEFTSSKSVKIVLRLVGLGLILFFMYFLATGFDEILSDGGFWFYGLGNAGLILSSGLLAIYLSMKNQSKNILIALFSLVGLSLLIIFVGVARF